MNNASPTIDTPDTPHPPRRRSRPRMKSRTPPVIGIPDDRLLYTYAEAQRILGVTHITVYRWAKSGKLAVVGSGPGRKITRASIERLCGVNV